MTKIWNVLRIDLQTEKSPDKIQYIAVKNSIFVKFKYENVNIQ